VNNTFFVPILAIMTFIYVTNMMIPHIVSSQEYSLRLLQWQLSFRVLVTLYMLATLQ